MTHPHEEMRAMKEAKAHYDMFGFIADAQYGIPKKCPCGGSIINEVSPHLKYPNDKDTLPGRKFFTCNRFEDDGMHFRQPWVFGVQEELEKMTSRVDEMASEIEQLKTQILISASPISNMSSSSASSIRVPRSSTHGVPSRCWCGEGIKTYGSSTPENLYRRFYRCELGVHKKSENHLFKWVDEALLDEIRSVDAKQDGVARRLGNLEEMLYENVKSEFAGAKQEITQKLNDLVKVKIESVRVKIESVMVQKEMNKKLKLATMAMLAVGAIVGICSAL